MRVAQGDGEVCGTAIEVAGTFTAELHLRKGEATRRGVRSPQSFRDGNVTDPVWQAPKRFCATTGLALGTDGTNASEDAALAAAQALHQMIDCLAAEWGYTRRQAYPICSVGVDLRISELVDVPNFVVTAVLPLDVFVRRPGTARLAPGRAVPRVQPAAAPNHLGRCPSRSSWSSPTHAT